jgi:hypothetical protein
VLRGERLLADGEYTFEERLGLCEAALGKIECGEILESVGDVTMVRAERLLQNGYGAVEERRSSA